MIVIWKTTAHEAAILYQEGVCPRLVTPEQAQEAIEAWHKDSSKTDYSLCEGTHLPSFDGPWPTQEELTKQYEHRFDWMKDMTLHWLDCSTMTMEPAIVPTKKIYTAK